MSWRIENDILQTMARQDTDKRRTGCVTRAYFEPPVGSYSWQHLLQAKQPMSPRHSGTLSRSSTRSPDYFRWMVAPALNLQLSNGSLVTRSGQSP
jgi:hypothetical protein